MSTRTENIRQQIRNGVDIAIFAVTLPLFGAILLTPKIGATLSKPRFRPVRDTGHDDKGNRFVPPEQYVNGSVYFPHGSHGYVTIIENGSQHNVLVSDWRADGTREPNAEILNDGHDSIVCLNPTCNTAHLFEDSVYVDYWPLEEKEKV